MRYARALGISFILLLLVAMPALSSASGGELTVAASKPAIFIGESVTITLNYQAPPGENISSFDVTVLIAEIGTGSIIERIEGVMSAGGNFSCSFTANESTDFGYYSAYAIVENVSGMAKFQVSPSLLDNWLLEDRILKQTQEITGMLAAVFTYFIPVAALIGCTVGAFAYVKSRLPESDWEDFKKWFFRGREWRLWKKFSPFTDVRDTDRQGFMKSHFKTITSYEGKLDVVRYDRIQMEKLYDKKKEWMLKNLARFIDGDNFLAEMKVKIEGLKAEEKSINDRIEAEILRKKAADLAKRRRVKRIVKKTSV